jgi:hypothetical protein
VAPDAALPVGEREKGSSVISCPANAGAETIAKQASAAILSSLSK